MLRTLLVLTKEKRKKKMPCRRNDFIYASGKHLSRFFFCKKSAVSCGNIIVIEKILCFAVGCEQQMSTLDEMDKN